MISSFCLWIFFFYFEIETSTTRELRLKRWFVWFGFCLFEFVECGTKCNQWFSKYLAFYAFAIDVYIHRTMATRESNRRRRRKSKANNWQTWIALDVIKSANYNWILGHYRLLQRNDRTGRQMMTPTTSTRTKTSEWKRICRHRKWQDNK